MIVIVEILVVTIVIIMVVVMVAMRCDENHGRRRNPDPVADEEVPVHLPKSFCQSDFFGGRKPICGGCFSDARRLASQSKMTKPRMVSMGAMVRV